MAYSELVTAIKEKDSARVDRLLREIHPRLVRFLRIHMGAVPADAEDCVQEAIYFALAAVREDRLRDPGRIFSYLLTTCRNNYLKLLEQRKETNYDEVPETSYHRPRQLQNLLDEEQMRILEQCMGELKEEYREFMEYWFERPGSHAGRVADHFGLSVNNVWTRKHRIIKQLNDCYKKKSNL